jgi:RNA polymerase sigma factor (sigma-70 family)
VEETDLELLHAYAQGGDEAAFARLVERHGGWILGAARRRLRDDHLADDAAQAVFLTLAEKAGTLLKSGRTSLAPWLFHVVHFTCSRLRRTQTRLVNLVPLTEPIGRRRDPPNFLADHDLIALMEDCIAQLPCPERELIIRRYYRHQNLDEVGKAADISADAARKRIARALLAVRSSMLRDVDSIPDALLADFDPPRAPVRRLMPNREVVMDQPVSGGFNLISVEFLVRDVEENLQFFETLGFPRRWLDKPDADGKLPRASLTAGAMGKVWIRRVAQGEQISPSPSINPFFWVDGGPEALVQHRKRIADQGVSVSAIIDEYALPNYAVTTPDGYAVRFFTQYV